MGLSADVAIDLVGLGLVAFMGWAAAAVVTDEGAERSSPLAVLAIHFGAGLAFVLLAGVDGRHPRCLVQYHHPTCGVELFPTQFLNVFQHPVAVGVPMFLVFVLLAPRVSGLATRWHRSLPKVPTAPDGGPPGPRVCLRRQAGSRRRRPDPDRSPPDGPWRPSRSSSSEASPSVSSSTLPWAAWQPLAALIVAPRPEAGMSRAQGAGWLFVVLGLGLGLAFVEGGMLASNPSIDPRLVGLRSTPGFPRNEGGVGILWHHAVNLGVGFLLLPVFVFFSAFRPRPQVALLTAFSIGGILVAHLFFYSRSWDIVKFPSAASFALSMLYVAVADDRLRAAKQASHEPRRTALRWARRFGAVLLLGTGVTSAAFITCRFPALCGCTTSAGGTAMRSSARRSPGGGPTSTAAKT